MSSINLKSVMNKKPLLVFLPLSLMVSACAPVYQQQPPIQGARVVRPSYPAPPKPPARKAPPRPTRKHLPDTVTYPIDSAKSNITVEPNTPAFRIDPLAPPVEASSAATPMSTPGMNYAPAAPAVPAYAVEDVRLPTGSSPAVVALLTQADRNRATGDLDAAVVVTERALRIESRNPTLTYKLAQLRIKQNKPQLAEELAGKAALLAGSNLDLKRKSWLLIAEARRMQQNYQGAREAQAKAESFFGR